MLAGAAGWAQFGPAADVASKVDGVSTG